LTKQYITDEIYMYLWPFQPSPSPC